MEAIDVTLCPSLSVLLLSKHGINTPSLPKEGFPNLSPNLNFNCREIYLKS